MTATFKPIALDLGGATPVASFRFPLPPVPASRVRVTRWGAYHLKTYRSWLDAAGEYLARVGGSVPDRPLFVVVAFVCKKPQKPKKTLPKGDIDNFLKAPLDALTHAAVWADDALVAGAYAVKRYAAEGEQPHTALDVYVCG